MYEFWVRFTQVVVIVYLEDMHNSMMWSIAIDSKQHFTYILDTVNQEILACRKKMSEFTIGTKLNRNILRKSPIREQALQYDLHILILRICQSREIREIKLHTKFS